MAKIARSKMKNSITEEAHRIYAKRMQAKVPTLIEKTLLDMLPLGNNAASNGI